MFDPLIILMRVLVISDGGGMVVYDPVPDVYVAGPSYPPPVIVQPSYVQPVYPNGTSLEPIKSSFSNHSDRLSSRFVVTGGAFPANTGYNPGYQPGGFQPGYQQPNAFAADTGSQRNNGGAFAADTGRAW